MNELKQVNPYETPQSPSSRRRFNYFLYGSMIATVLVAGSAAAWMMITTSVKVSPDKNESRIYMNRGPVRDLDAKSPVQAQE